MSRRLLLRLSSSRCCRRRGKLLHISRSAGRSADRRRSCCAPRSLTRIAAAERTTRPAAQFRDIRLRHPRRNARRERASFRQERRLPAERLDGRASRHVERADRDGDAFPTGVERRSRSDVGYGCVRVTTVGQHQSDRRERDVCIRFRRTHHRLQSTGRATVWRAAHRIPPATHSSVTSRRPASPERATTSIRP